MPGKTTLFDIAAAEKLAGLEYTGSVRALMIGHVERSHFKCGKRAEAGAGHVAG